MAHIPSVLGWAGFKFVCQLEQKLGLALGVAVCNFVALEQ